MKIYWLHAPDSICLNDCDFFSYFNSFNEDSKNYFEKIIDGWIKHLIEIDVDFITLNPLILNFLTDELAKKHLFVKTKNGFKAIGEVEKVLFKFDLLRAGEICCDTDFSILD
jgi:hypothetical protein